MSLYHFAEWVHECLNCAGVAQEASRDSEDVQGAGEKFDQPIGTVTLPAYGKSHLSGHSVWPYSSPIVNRGAVRPYGNFAMELRREVVLHLFAM